MIASFNHKGLKRLYELGERKLIRPDLVERVSTLLANLEIPSLRLHPLKGRLAGYWAIDVRANWRIIFRYADGMATNVELIDYH